MLGRVRGAAEGHSAPLKHFTRPTGDCCVKQPRRPNALARDEVSIVSPLRYPGGKRRLWGYIAEVMGVYRQHAGGLYSVHSEEEKQRRTLEFYRAMNSNLAYRHDRLARAATSRYFLEWAEEYEGRGDIEAARRCFRTSLQEQPVNGRLSPLRLLKLGLRLYVTGPRVRA